MDNEKEISFGAFDSELMHQEIFIPEGFEATIDGNKIILKKIESEDERIRKELIEHVKDQQSSFISAPDCRDKYEEEENNKYNSWLSWLEKQGTLQDKGEISDEYHTFNELYYYRMLYNAAFFNMLPKEWVHKSKKHHDGEDCFGGGWFIVMANLPTGQISNHYELKNWDLFQIPEKEVADKWDGHTPQEAADRLHKYLLEKQSEQKSDADCLLSWSEIDEKRFQSLEGILEDYWAKAEREKNEIKIREASDVSYFLKTIQKSPLCWIKCSDGLPNRDGTYLVVTDGRHNDVYDMARYDSIDGWHKASEIIYWMPIPQLNNKSIIEQKSAEWSEEDEHRIKDTIYFLETAKKHYASTVELDNCINWLKAIKDRYSWKPSSELDETSYQVGIKRVLENPESYGLTKYNWKPSDEQMHAFEQVYDWYNNNFAPSETLTSLYKDLEKLKGE